jgi:K+-transporting ATPase KdpF subunit
MDIGLTVAGLIALVLLLYLTYAIAFPERF